MVFTGLTEDERNIVIPETEIHLQQTEEPSCSKKIKRIVETEDIDFNVFSEHKLFP
jgi:hypothetical protein